MNHGERSGADRTAGTDGTAYDFADDLLSRLRDDYMRCERNGHAEDSALFIYHRRLFEESGGVFDPDDAELAARLRRQCMNYLDNHGYALTTAHRASSRRKPRAKDKPLKLIGVLCAKQGLHLSDGSDINVDGRRPYFDITGRRDHTPEPAGVGASTDDVLADDIIRLMELIGDDELYDGVVIPLRWDARTGAALYLLGRSWVTDLIDEDTDRQCFFVVLTPQDYRSTTGAGRDTPPHSGLLIGVGMDDAATRQVFDDWDEALEWYRRLTEGWLLREFTYAHNVMPPERCPDSLRRFFEDDDPLFDSDAWRLTPAEEREYQEFLSRLHAADQRGTQIP